MKQTAPHPNTLTDLDAEFLLDEVEPQWHSTIRPTIGVANNPSYPQFRTDATPGVSPHKIRGNNE